MKKDDPRIGYLANLAGRIFSREIVRRLKDFNAGGGQIPVLTALREGEKLPQKTLAKMAEIEQPTMAQLLARMERDGIVERTPDPNDGRSTLFSLTAKGHKLVPKAMKVILEVNDAALEGFTEREVRQLSALLIRVIENLEKL